MSEGTHASIAPTSIASTVVIGLPSSVARAFSSEVDAGSREENASKQKSGSRRQISFLDGAPVLAKG